MTRKFDTKTNKKGEFTQVGLVARRLQDHRQQGRLPGHLRRHPRRPRRADPASRHQARDQGRGPGGGGRRGGQGQRRAARDVRQGQPAQPEGKFDEAIAAYNEVLAKNPQVAEAHYNIGYLQAQKKDWAGAEAAYQKALEVRPGYGEAIVRAGQRLPGQRPGRQGHGAPDQGGRGQPEGRQGPVQPGRLLPQRGQDRRGGGGLPEGRGADPAQRRDLLLPGHDRRGPEQDPRGRREPREVPLDEPDRTRRTWPPPRGCSRRSSPRSE